MVNSTIVVQKIINCKLSIIRVIDGKNEKSIIKGKGYYKDNNGEKVIFFSSDDIKYKYLYRDDGKIIVLCNDSKYVFEENVRRIAEIKSGEYVFKIATLATKIDFSDNCIRINYNLYQKDILMGIYYSELSFN